MTVINTDTNTVIAGFPCPVGVFELPVEGSVGVLTTGWTTNFTVGSGDTVIAWSGGADMLPGVPVWEWYVAGLGVSFLLIGFLIIRKGLRLLVRGPERIDL